MSTQNIIFIVLIVTMFVYYFIISPLLKYKEIQKNNEKHSNFLNELKIGDNVVLNSGILGVLKEKNEKSYSIEISRGIIMEVLPASIIGRS